MVRGVSQHPTSKLRKKGSAEGQSPFGGGLGVSPRYTFYPLPKASVMVKGFFSTLLKANRPDLGRGDSLFFLPSA